ncbi:MAG: putative porin [Rickettsiales bacterium]|jgi:hypothetical protein|nr:putative porin [Rickettsiales bacterium]
MRKITAIFIFLFLVGSNHPAAFGGTPPPLGGNLIDVLVEKGVITEEEAKRIQNSTTPAASQPPLHPPILRFGATSLGGELKKTDPVAGRGVPRMRPWLPDDNLIPPIGQQSPWQGEPGRSFVFYGDLRLRTEYDYYEQNNFHRFRERFRLRLAADTLFSEDFRASFGLVSGMMAAMPGTPEEGRVGDLFPATGNITFDSFNRIPAMVNFGYIQYAPSDNFSVAAGKIKNGVQAWAPSQLVWRYDVNPDGIALNWKTNRDASFNYFSYAGFYFLGEYRSIAPAWMVAACDDNPDTCVNPGNGHMPWGGIVQVGTNYSQKNLLSRFGLSVQQWNLKDILVRSTYPQWLGGAMPGVANFTLINPGWDVRFQNIWREYTLTLYGDYSYNADPDPERRGNRNGLVAAFLFGDEDLDGAGRWFFRFEFYYVEPHAIPIGFGNPNTMLFGRINGMPSWQGAGVRYNLNHALSQGMSFNWNYYYTHDRWTERDEHRVQLDLLYRF